MQRKVGPLGAWRHSALSSRIASIVSRSAAFVDADYGSNRFNLHRRHSDSIPGRRRQR